MSGAGPEHEHGGPRCRELFEKLSEYIDGEIDPSICSEMESHLTGCPPCLEFLESLKRTVRIMNRLPGAALPPDVRRELMEAASRLRGGKPPQS